MNATTTVPMIRAYLRASTAEQDADRAREPLKKFAADHGMRIATFYVENVSGATLERPELMKLIADSDDGDVILIEQVDRISRLADRDWQTLRSMIAAKHLRVVALDLPTSWSLIKTGDEFTSRMLDALNGMMLDMLAAIARKDYTDRKRRQAEGIAKLTPAEKVEKYRGKAEDVKRNAAIESLLREGKTWSMVQTLTSASRTHISKIAKRIAQQA